MLNQYVALGGMTAAFYGVLKKTAVAAFVFAAAFFLDEYRLERLIPPLYVSSILLLFFVAWHGKTVKGSTRWIDIAGVTLQPTELAKIFTPLMSAHLIYITRNRPPLVILSRVLISTLLPFLLIIKQPDLGSALLLLIASLLPLLISPIPLKYFWKWAGVTFLLLPLSWHFLYPYQKNRILTLLSSQEDLLGQGYHIHQSKIAIGSGGLWGKGLGCNTQGAYRFLPEHDTDFAFALFSEEWGFIGSATVIILFYAVVTQLLFSLLRVRSYYAQLICYALVAPIFISVCINIGMVSGVLPVVGVPLPLFSRGGTCLLSFALSIGLLVSLRYKSTGDRALRT
jgi:rod shape determining protein RodA